MPTLLEDRNLALQPSTTNQHHLLTVPPEDVLCIRKTRRMWGSLPRASPTTLPHRRQPPLRLPIDNLDGPKRPLSHPLLDIPRHPTGSTARGLAGGQGNATPRPGMFRRADILAESYLAVLASSDFAKDDVLVDHFTAGVVPCELEVGGFAAVRAERATCEETAKGFRARVRVERRKANGKVQGTRSRRKKVSETSLMGTTNLRDLHLIRIPPTPLLQLIHRLCMPPRTGIS